MFTPTTRSFQFIAGVLLLFSCFKLSGQEQAGINFEKGNYRSALSEYRELMKSDPGNAMNSYYAGRCLVELNEELAEAIELLYGASKKGVPSDVNYFLGLAYHRDYNFHDAKKYFGRFEVKASRQELRDYNVKHMLGTTRSAKEITASYNPYEVMNVTFIDLFDSLQFSQVKMKGGQLQRKPSAYYMKDEDRLGLTSLTFVPKNAVRGDYIYFSGYNRNGKDKAQLFRVRKGSGKSWGDPEEIEALNSTGNDILPYFDPIDNDLYFASDGRMGVGGYDLYRTHYDRERDLWSDPVNLGFPVNSAVDDYLLLPGSDLGMVMFFSTRQGTDSTVTVYRVHLVEPKKNTVANDNVMLKKIAHMGGAAEDILAELEALESKDSYAGTVDGASGISKERGQPAITPVVILYESDTKQEYQLLLAEALQHQADSDSLKDLAANARVRVRVSEDPNDRWVWQKQIMLWEKKARDEEVMADELYARMEVEQLTQESKPAVIIPETIEVDTVMNELTVYKYTEPVSTFNMFEILGNSPYSHNNPIPMDIILPQGAFYRIQIGAFGAEVEADAFLGLTPISGEELEERGIIKYYAGEFSKYDDASSALSRIRSNGYEDAFIVSWYNGSEVSTHKAKQLE